MAGMSGSQLASTSTEVLEHECVTLAAEIAALTCRWFLVIAELDRREVWGSGGYRSMAHYVSHRCSLSMVTAREHVRVARALLELPRTRESFGRGELTYSKVRALVRVATPDAEADLVELARTATAEQLEQIIRATVVATTDLERSEELRDVHLGIRDDGLGELRAVMRPDELALVETAIGVATRAGDDSAESSSSPRMDAVVRIFESYLANGESCREGAASTQLVVHVEVDASTGEITGAETESGIPLAPETASRLSCDVRLFTIVHDQLVPLGSGRSQRNPSRKLRRALRRRSKGVCEWHGCEERRFTQLHHVRPWGEGGSTEWWNLVNLCWHHHHLVHEGGWRIGFDRRTGAIHVFRPDGSELQPVHPRVDLRRFDRQIDDERVVPLWAGERFDLEACVDAVLDWTKRQPA